MYTQPGKPTQNADNDRFNSTTQHEWLDMHEFDRYANAQNIAIKWLGYIIISVQTQQLVAYHLEPFYKHYDSLVIFFFKCGIITPFILSLLLLSG